MVEQIRKMPVPMAIYGRYGLLGLILGYSIDNMFGSLTYPFLLVITVLIASLVPAALLHWRSNRQLAYFIKYYAMSVERQVREKAINVLRQEMAGLYQGLRQKVGDPQRREDSAYKNSEDAKLDDLGRFLSRPVQQSPMAAPDDSPAYFHVPVDGRIASGNEQGYLPVLEAGTKLGYWAAIPFHWPSEIDRLNGERLLQDWRRMVLLPSAEGLPGWLTLHQARLKFRTDYLVYARKRFADDVSKAATLPELLKASSREHLDKVFQRVVAHAYSPIYTEQPERPPQAYWVSASADRESILSEEVFPLLATPEWSHFASADGTHLRFFMIRDFAPRLVPFFDRCRIAFEKQSVDHKEKVAKENIPTETEMADVESNGTTEESGL